MYVSIVQLNPHNRDNQKFFSANYPQLCALFKRKLKNGQLYILIK